MPLGENESVSPNRWRWQHHDEISPVWPGHHQQLGATWSEEATNFAVWSPEATALWVCLFDDEGHETRWQLMRRATALINPSRHESLSLVLLEAWVCDVPVIVSSLCDVTVGQCARSDGGFSVDFGDPEGAARTVEGRLRDPAAMAAMGRPTAFATNGTVRLARGLTSST